MKGKEIVGLSGYEGKLVWVEFEDPEAATCENCGACGSSVLANSVYRDGLYRVQGHLLVSPADPQVYFSEYIPRIQRFYAWVEEAQAE